jgi:curved DNA-binding protein
MANKSYYDILGVAKDADKAAIKTAYRRLAKKYHPDTTKDEDGEAKFKAAKEAYEILKDDQKRAYYDQFGTGRPNPRQGQQQYHYSTAGDINLDEMMRRFHEMNDGNPNPTYGTDGTMVVQKVPVPVEAMIHGGKIAFQYTEQKASNHRFLSLTQKIGRTVLKPNTKVGEAIEIDDAPNMKFILIAVGSEKCAVQGIDLIVPFNANALEAAVGHKCRVEHPDGKAYEVAIPKGSQNGTALRLPKKGLHHVNGAVGSLIAIVNYTIPDLSEEQQVALKKLLKGA